MADFSHLSRLPLSSFLPPVQTGQHLSDEFFDHLLNRIEPPLFDERRMRALRAELCWFASTGRMGRPLKGCRRTELAAAVQQLRRDDIPPPLIEAIRQRLAIPAPRDRLRIPRAAMKRRQKADRLLLMRATYSNLIAVALEGKEPYHPFIAEKALMLVGSRRPREDAVRLTHDIMRDSLHLWPPDVRRVRNLVLKKSHRVFVKLPGGKPR